MVRFFPLRLHLVLVQWSSRKRIFSIETFSLSQSIFFLFFFPQSSQPQISLTSFTLLLESRDLSWIWVEPFHHEALAIESQTNLINLFLFLSFRGLLQILWCRASKDPHRFFFTFELQKTLAILTIEYKKTLTNISSFLFVEVSYIFLCDYLLENSHKSFFTLESQKTPSFSSAIESDSHNSFITLSFKGISLIFLYF